MKLNKISFSLLCNIVLMFTGCANLQTVRGSVSIPPLALKETENGANGKVIRSDAQQRFMTVNSLGQYCTEPSPDAIGAYGSSNGLAAGKPESGSISIQQALQGSAASIGLRTQSITLMRDSLYRICEAHANGMINDTQAALLLAKNQDSLIVALAVEQLTGAVVARQVAITSNSTGNSSAEQKQADKDVDGETADKKKTTPNSSVNTGATPIFAEPAKTITLSDTTATAALNQVAKSVESMVEAVLNKDYSQEMCSAVLMSGMDDIDKEYLKHNCRMYLINMKRENASDNTTLIILKAMQKDTKLGQKILKYLSDNHKGLNIGEVLNDSQYVNIREEIVENFIKIK